MSAFPPLEKPSLFLASPGDVTHLRRMANSIFQEIIDSNGRKVGVHFFAYENANLGNNDSKPIQETISRPDDDNSRGLAAFFGERVGQDLPDDFPRDMLENIPGLIEGSTYEGKQYRLIHPWVEGSETGGGFPLTGSTFEVLCAYAGQLRRDNLASANSLPSFICFASPPEVLAQSDATKAGWGGREELRRIQSEHADDMTEQLEQMVRLKRQVNCLRNFACYLKTRGLEVHYIPKAEDIAEAYRNWLRANFIAGSYDPSKINPFMGLRS